MMGVEGARKREGKAPFLFFVVRPTFNCTLCSVRTTNQGSDVVNDVPGTA